MWRCSWRPKCDRCGDDGPTADSSKDAEEKAIRQGWLKGAYHGIAIHLCERCVKRGTPKWWPTATSLCLVWDAKDDDDKHKEGGAKS